MLPPVTSCPPALILARTSRTGAVISGKTCLRFLGPVLNLEVRDLLEVPDIPGDQNGRVFQHRRRDAQIHSFDLHLTFAEALIALHRGLVISENLQTREETHGVGQALIRPGELPGLLRLAECVYHPESCSSTVSTVMARPRPVVPEDLGLRPHGLPRPA